MARIPDRGIFGIVGLLLLFLLFTYNRDLALAYLIILLIDFALFISDKTKLFVFEKTSQGRLQGFLFVFIVWVVYLFGLPLIVSLFTTGTTTIQSLIQLQAQTAFVIAPLATVSLLIFGVLIPITETKFFFQTFFEFMKDVSKTTISLNILTRAGQKTHSLIFMIATIFAFFHITVLQQGGAEFFTEKLIITFVFGYISQILVIKFKQAREAVFLHIIHNSFIMLVRLGVISSGIFGG